MDAGPTPVFSNTLGGAREMEHREPTRIGAPDRRADEPIEDAVSPSPTAGSSPRR
jgi:hypothetical protein